MRPSLLLVTATRLLLPLLLLFSLLLLFRGHDAPGGGFVGGVVAAAALSLHALAFGAGQTRQLFRVPPVDIVAMGLLVALGSSLAAPAAGRPWFAGMWSGLKVPGVGELGTPLLFDIGIYLVVVGGVLLMFFPLMEE